MELDSVYLIEDFVTRERWRTPLLLMALAGAALFFVRGGLAKIVGCLLLLARLAAMPMTDMEWVLLGAIVLMGAVTVALRRREEPSSGSEQPGTESPEPDDPREPAPCPACHGVIPAGQSRCPNCGWTYTADVS